MGPGLYACRALLRGLGGAAGQGAGVVRGLGAPHLCGGTRDMRSGDAAGSSCNLPPGKVGFYGRTARLTAPDSMCMPGGNERESNVSVWTFCFCEFCRKIESRRADSNRFPAHYE